MAFSPVSNAPLTTPLRRIVAPIVARARRVPTIGSDRRNRADILMPPHRAIRFAIVIRQSRANAMPLGWLSAW